MQNHPDAAKWNEKHKTHPYADEPSESLIQLLPLLKPGGRVLDIACGTGRNSRYLHAEGFEVEAVDISEYAITKVSETEGIAARVENMEIFNIEAERYDLILNIHFLKRRLWPLIKEGLKPGGYLLYETYVEDPTTPLESFKNRDHYLRKNELLHAFIGLHIHLYHERRVVRNRDTCPAHLATLIAQN